MLRLLEILRENGGEGQSLTFAEKYKKIDGSWVTNDGIFRVAEICVKLGYAEIMDTQGREVSVSSLDAFRGFNHWDGFHVRLTPAGQHLAEALPPLPIKNIAEDKSWNIDFWTVVEPTLQLLSRIVNPLDANLSWWLSKTNFYSQAGIYHALREYERADLIKRREFTQSLKGIKEVTPTGYKFAQAITEAEGMVREAKKAVRPEKSGLLKIFFGQRVA